MRVCLYVYVYVYHVQAVPVEGKRGGLRPP